MFTYLRYGISTRDFHEWAPLDIFDIFCVFSEDVAGLGIWWNVLSNQFGNLTFFWVKVDKWQSLRFLHIAIFIFEYMSLWKWILLYFLSWFWFIPLRLRKKSLDRKTKVKQKCWKVSVIGKKLFSLFPRNLVDYYE